MPSVQTAFQRLALVNAVALALASHAAAQSNAAGEGAVLELAPSTVTSESIVRDAVVDVITATDIENSQVDNFDDLVKFIPGVSVSRGDDRWGASGFNIRGLD